MVVGSVLARRPHSRVRPIPTCGAGSNGRGSSRLTRCHVLTPRPDLQRQIRRFGDHTMDLGIVLTHPPSRRCAASVQAAQGAPNGLEDRYDPCPRRAEPVQAFGEHPMHLLSPSTAKITRGTPHAQIPTILYASTSSFCIQKCSCRYRLSRDI